MIKKILNFIFTDLFTLITSSACVLSIWMADHFLHQGTDVSSFQIYGGITLMIIPIVVAWMTLFGFRWVIFFGTAGTKRSIIINYITAILIFLCGYLMIEDFKNRPFQYEKITDENIDMVDTEKSIIFEFKRGDGSSYIMSCKKSDLKYNTINELEFYESYKIDMFGKKTPGVFCVKSLEMENYIYTLWKR